MQQPEDPDQGDPPVILFPPILTKGAGPPRLPADPRQERLDTILKEIVGTPAPRTGFRASAVDLGRLKGVLESGLQAFTIDTLRSRWDVDVESWICDTVFHWVQRCKTCEATLEEDCAYLEFTAKDDQGTFRYAFAVFPGRRAGPTPGTV